MLKAKQKVIGGVFLALGSRCILLPMMRLGKRLDIYVRLLDARLPLSLPHEWCKVVESSMGGRFYYIRA